MKAIKKLGFRGFAITALTVVGLSLNAAEAAIPFEYDQDRFFVVPVLEGGESLRLLTDTGGGVFIFDDAALRTKLSVSGVTLEDYKGMAAAMPTFAEGKGIPLPKTEGDVIPIAPAPVRHRLAWFTKDIDGIIGQGWFADRMWTLDYPGKKLIWHDDGKTSPGEKMRRVPLGFRTNEKGVRAISYPRVEVQIAGKTHDMLLATGATVALSAETHKTLNDGIPVIRAASLVANSVFEQWQKDHPDWRVLNNAEEESGEPMIEVPQVTLGGIAIGPVWFTRRSDDNFSEHFSSWTDKPVFGAIGGNVLRHFRVILDYPNAVAWVERP